jgi:hypothetical protein
VTGFDPGFSSRPAQELSLQKLSGPEKARLYGYYSEQQMGCITPG